MSLSNLFQMILEVDKSKRVNNFCIRNVPRHLRLCKAPITPLNPIHSIVHYCAARPNNATIPHYVSRSTYTLMLFLYTGFLYRRQCNWCSHFLLWCDILIFYIQKLSFYQTVTNICLCSVEEDNDRYVCTEKLIFNYSILQCFPF